MTNQIQQNGFAHRDIGGDYGNRTCKQEIVVKTTLHHTHPHYTTPTPTLPTLHYTTYTYTTLHYSARAPKLVTTLYLGFMSCMVACLTVPPPLLKPRVTSLWSQSTIYSLLVYNRRIPVVSKMCVCVHWSALSEIF